MASAEITGSSSCPAATAGRREGKFSVDVVPGTQDLDYRVEIDVLFCDEPVALITPCNAKKKQP